MAPLDRAPTRVRRSVRKLADGREIIYYDERDVLRNAVDTRELPAPAAASELRYDPLRDEWVAVATHRQTRTFLPSKDECPLCPSTPEHATEVPERDYDVVVFENRFPSFATTPPATPSRGGSALSPTRPGLGRCEVVCFTADHNANFADLPPSRVRTVIDALADRSRAIGELPGVEQVFCFENRGVEIGVTLDHPHGQIYGYPFVTPHTRAMLAAARRHRPGNLMADIIAAESVGPRVVAANDDWIAYVPAAARWPFEVHVVCRRQVPDLPALSDTERDAFGPLYLQVLRRLDAVFGIPMPYVAAWHQAPVRVDRELAWLHLQLFSIRRAPGKLKYLAGSESAMGAFINDIAPEEAARLLREGASSDG